MARYEVTLSDAEIRAMEHICFDPNDWIQTAFRHRVNTAIAGLSDLEMAKALKNKQDIIVDRMKLIELSIEPPMSQWLEAEHYNPNPDDPFVNPSYKLDDPT